MSEPSPVLPLPAIKSPRPHFSFSTNEPYMPPDPSRFTHFMPSPISSSGARSLDLPSPSMLSTGVPLGGSGSRGSASPGNYTTATSYGQKRSYMEHDTASPEAGSSLDETVKEEGDDSTANLSISSAAGGGGGGENGGSSSSGRALKNTKRAAQNRAAQQAFRKRKEERIKELEEKEKELQLLRSRSEDLRRREQDLMEREQLFALRQIKAESIAAASAASTSNGHATSHVSSPAASSSHFPYATSTTLPHLQQQQQQQHAHGQGNHHSASSLSSQQQQHSAEQDARLDDAHKMLLDAQADYNELKCQLDERDGLIAALRRSLEDLGAENRAFRAAAGIQSPTLGEGPPGMTSDIRTAES